MANNPNLSLRDKTWNALLSLNCKGVMGPDTQDLCFEMQRLENVGISRSLQDIHGGITIEGEPRLIDVRHLSLVAWCFWCVEDPSLVGENDCPLRFYMTEEDRERSSWPEHTYVGDYELSEEIWND